MVQRHHLGVAFERFETRLLDAQAQRELSPGERDDGLELAQRGVEEIGARVVLLLLVVLERQPGPRKALELGAIRGQVDLDRGIGGRLVPRGGVVEHGRPAGGEHVADVVAVVAGRAQALGGRPHLRRLAGEELVGDDLMQCEVRPDSILVAQFLKEAGVLRGDQPGTVICVEGVTLPLPRPPGGGGKQPGARGVLVHGVDASRRIRRTPATPPAPLPRARPTRRDPRHGRAAPRVTADQAPPRRPPPSRPQAPRAHPELPASRTDPPPLPSDLAASPSDMAASNSSLGRLRPVLGT